MLQDKLVLDGELRRLGFDVRLILGIVQLFATKVPGFRWTFFLYLEGSGSDLVVIECRGSRGVDLVCEPVPIPRPESPF